MHPDPTVEKGLRMARSLARVSFVTRGIGILGVIGSLIGLLAAMDQRSSSDRLGFSLLSLGVLLISMVVWSTGAFHGTVARLAPMLARLDDKLDQALARPAVAQAAPPAKADVTPDTEPTPPPVEESRRVARAPEPKPEPVKIPCPSCGGLIHPEATRCVHCMKRVAHA